MKPFIVLFTFLNCFTLFAQDGTTLEEYRYLSKGYGYQIEMGLDAQKEDYLIKNLFKSTNGAELIGLYKTGTASPRGLLVILNNQSSTADYICIPNGTAGERVKELAAVDHNKLSTAQKQTYQIALNEFLFDALSKPELSTLSYVPPFQKSIPGQKDEKLVSRSADLNPYLPAAPIVQPIQAEKVKENKKVADVTYKGDVANRQIVSLEEAVSTTRKKGVIAIKVCVNANGNVSTAKFTQRGSTTFDAYLKKVALKAAKSIKFAQSEVPEQCGIVNYKF